MDLFEGRRLAFLRAVEIYGELQASPDAPILYELVSRPPVQWFKNQLRAPNSSP